MIRKMRRIDLIRAMDIGAQFPFSIGHHFNKDTMITSYFMAILLLVSLVVFSDL